MLFRSQVEQRSPKPRVPSSILGAPAKEKVLSDSDKTFFISLQKESTALIAKIVSQSGGFVFRKFTKWEQLETELLLQKVFSVRTCKKIMSFPNGCPRIFPKQKPIGATHSING